MDSDRLHELLPALATFVAVVESNNFAAAARRMGLTRSAVSKQVARLEEEWGVKLLRRTTRAVSLTEPGRQAYEHASRIPALAALARDSAADLSRSPRGLLRVTASVSFGQRVLVPLLPCFREQHPQVEVELHLLDRMVDIVEEGFDLAVRLSDRLPEGLVATKLGEVRYALRAAPKLPGLDAVQAPSDLERIPALRLSGRKAKEPWTLTRGTERAIVHPRGPLSASTSDALLSLALAGMGVALLPGFVDREAVARGELATILPDWKVQGPFGDAVWAVRPERNALPKVAAFTEFLAQALRAPEWNAQTATAALARAA